MGTNKLNLPDVPNHVTVWIWYNTDSRVGAYFCEGYYDKASFVERVRHDYGFYGTEYDCFHGSLVDSQLTQELTKDGTQVTYMEVMRR